MNIATGLLGIFLWAGILGSCNREDRVRVKSPDGKFLFELLLEESKPFYRVTFNNTEIIGMSELGLVFSGGRMAPEAVSIISIVESRVDTVWKPLYGERNQYRDHYHQAIIRLSQGGHDLPPFKLNIRAYNEGIAFRYEFEHVGKDTIEAELTAFALPVESELWISEKAQAPIEKRTIAKPTEGSFERPVLAQLNDSLFVALGEAVLVDFARMKFITDEERPGTILADLHGPVVVDGSFSTPWRFVMAGRSAGELLENNYLLLNLNEPGKIKNPGWIKPGKVIREVTLTTQGGIACVDFAVKHHMQYIEFDAGWYGNENDEASDATTVTLDPKRSKGPLDLQKVIQYADSKGIGVLLYVNRRALERQLEEILPLVKSWGVRGLKFGFVNVGSQEWTRWLHHAVQRAADFELMVDIHDEYRPTGYSRTYPNLMTQEGIRGDETSPDNTMVLKTLFVRMLAGAGDHTICYFAGRVNQMGSHASQLAKAVCIYSPLQFLYWYDRPAGSPGKVGGAGDSDNFIVEVPELSFFDQLPTVWDDTRILEGYPGEYATVARKSGSTWFVGALNGALERDFTISFGFLDPGTGYEATVYKDHMEVQTPTKVERDTVIVTSEDSFRQTLGKNQGMALIIKKQL